MQEKTILECINSIKSREHKELIEAVKKYGKLEVDTYIYNFKREEAPIIAGYLKDDPCDLIIYSIYYKKLIDNLQIIGAPKDDINYNIRIEEMDIFAGQLDYVTSDIIAKHIKN